MKLNEIKTVLKGEVDLKEGVIPVHITMTLEQVVRDGGITNNVQYFIMAGLIEMFKNGGPTKWPRELRPYEMTTSAALIESVKNLAPEQAAGMAVWLLNALQVPANFEANPFACSNPQMDTVEWVKWVLSRQD